MRNRMRLILTALAVLLVSSACEQAAPPTAPPTVERDPKCLQYGLDTNLGFTVVDDAPANPINPDDRYQKVTVDCKTQMVNPIEPPLPISEGLPDPLYGTTTPTQDPGMPVQKTLLTEPTSVQCLTNTGPDTPIESHWYILPADAFQCLVNPPYSADDAKCSGKIAGGFELSTTDGEVFELTNGISAPVQGVQLSFTKTQSQSKETAQLTSLMAETDVFWAPDTDTLWASALVLQRKWLKAGKANVCYGIAGTDCMIQDLEITETETYYLGPQAGPWSTVVESLLLIASKDQYFKSPTTVLETDQPEPNVWPFRHQEPGSPSTQNLKSSWATGVTLKWERNYSTLRKSQDTEKAKLEWKVFSSEASNSVSHSITIAGKSTAEIVFALSPDTGNPNQMRCFKAYSIGGHGETAISGAIFREEVCGP